MNKTIYYLSKNIGKEFIRLQEEGCTYIRNSKKENIHDTAMRSLVMHKKEAALVINNMYNLKNKIKVEELELYNNRYVTQNLINKETDVILKIKDKDIFFLIEHQSKVDYNMPRRIAEYQIEIIRQYIQNSKINNKRFRLPLVKAIIIYTGKEKWNASKSIEKMQVELEDTTNSPLGSYDVMEINKLTEEEKLYSEGALLKVAMFDMAETKEEILDINEKVGKLQLTKEENKLIREYLSRRLLDVFPNTDISEMLKNYKEEEENEDMLADVLRREIDKEKEEVRVAVRKETKITIAKEMIKQKMDIKTIQKCTKLTEKQIKELEEMKQQIIKY